MKTELKPISALIATAVWADGEYAEVEKTTVGEIADALELSTDALNQAVENAFNEIKDLDEDGVSKYITDNANLVAEEDAGPIYEALIQIICCDSVISSAEVENLIAISNALQIEPSTAILLLLDAVKDEPDMQIDFSEEEE